MLQKILFSLLLISLAACSKTSPQPDSSDKFAEMAKIRQRLQTKLGPEYDQPVAAATPEQITHGKRLYEKACATCHGPDGKPRPYMIQSLVKPPANLASAKIANFYSERARIDIIKNGISGTPMKGWRGMLTDEDILCVFMFTRTLIKEN